MPSNKSIVIAYLIRTLNVCFSKTRCSNDCEYRDTSSSRCKLILWRPYYIEYRYGQICARFDEITCHSSEGISYRCGSSCVIQSKNICKLTILKKVLLKNKDMKIEQ